jgi:hypothetical protein
MENCKLYTWTATMTDDGPFFEFSFIATSPEAARQGALDKLREIKKAKVFLNPDGFFPDELQTDYASDEFFDISNFTEDTKLENGELLVPNPTLARSTSRVSKPTFTRFVLKLLNIVLDLNKLVNNKSI